ncbi:MAG TPA: o-succinylbenzoate synthase [Acidimicrobiales bacterium]
MRPLGALHGVELRRVRLPLVEPWRTALGIVTERDVWLVRTVFDGAEGWGECVAMGDPSYSAEYTEGAVDVLRRHLLPCLAASPGPLTGAEVAGVLHRVKGHPMAKAAIELAVLDAEGRAEGQPLAARLGATASRVAAGVAVGVTDSADALVRAVAERVAEGYTRVKLKIHPGWDLEPVQAVRASFGSLALQVDANGSYRPADAAALAALDPFELLCIEQPLADDDLIGHRELARTLRTPICLDESITSAAATRTAITLGACGVVNIKPGRVGGYLEAVRIHDLCVSHRIPVWCGGMLETGIGRAANLALAALEGFSLPGDLSASDRFYREDITEPVTLNPDGTIDVPSAPGTGAVLRTHVLADRTVGLDWWPFRP